jgi:hypothetical protein
VDWEDTFFDGCISQFVKRDNPPKRAECNSRNNSAGLGLLVFISMPLQKANHQLPSTSREGSVQAHGLHQQLPEIATLGGQYPEALRIA